MANVQHRKRIVAETRLAQLLAAVAILLGATRSAHAHISVDEGGTHKSRYSDDGMKDSPCGMTGGKRGANVYKYKPGATINISIVETVSHPGYFRIAFDADGDDDFVIPSGTSGENGNCSGDSKCGAGKEDFCNSDTVLIDNLDPHASNFGTQKKYTWSVKLPNIECANCTLQIIQMMNDLNFHPQPYPADDIYYQCIDIELTNSAPDVTDTPVETKGMECKSSGGPTAGQSGGEAGSGQAGSGPTAGIAGSSEAGSAGATAGAGASGAVAGANAGTAGASAAAGSGVVAGAGTTPTTRPPSGGSSSTPAGAAGSRSNQMSPVSGQAGGATSAAPPAAAPPASSSSGGCHVAVGDSANAFGALTLSLLVLALRRRPKRRAHTL